MSDATIVDRAEQVMREYYSMGPPKPEHVRADGVDTRLYALVLGACFGVVMAERRACAEAIKNGTGVLTTADDADVLSWAADLILARGEP